MDSRRALSAIENPSGDEIVHLLERHYPRVKTPLIHKNQFQLLIATMLSAQCTDERVNRVTPALFGKFPDAGKMSLARLAELERIIKSTGFFHVKSRRIREVSKAIVEKFEGKVPKTMDELISLNGIGRKTANIVLSAGYDKIEGIAVDTHVHRLANRIGLSQETSPEKIEKDLIRITRKENWPQLSMLLILHGRKICNARKPLCEKCPITSECRYYSKIKIQR
ncbi:MAG: endonuclease III [Nitrososphaerota archaeon]|nr:endonuclease III [Nitrososphaerota archaeon]MDG6921786.1 endonuclease III [Nitrososphaerota archaeon]